MNDISIPKDWAHFRSIDYHESSPLAVVFVSLSPTDEAFVWNEYSPNPEKNTTYVIAEEIAKRSKDYAFTMNLIDPRAAITQTNTSRSVVDDLNSYFYVFKKEEKCKGGIWETFDTKSTRGRDKIRERLINSALCMKPFNNEVVVEGVTKRLPTLWVFNSCMTVARSLQLWRMEGEKPAQEWSHYCTALEGLLKDIRFRPHIYRQDKKINITRQYFRV